MFMSLRDGRAQMPTQSELGGDGSPALHPESFTRRQGGTIKCLAKGKRAMVSVLHLCTEGIARLGVSRVCLLVAACFRHI